MNFAGWILKISGWKVDVTVPDYPKCIICVAPHTSNWDFVIGKLAYSSIGRKAGFLMKESWFFWPMGAIFRALGGVPVPRGKKRKGSLVDFLIDKFNSSEKLAIAITPEGTRSRTADWHTGFLRIALAAKVPVTLGALDFKNKNVVITDTFYPTDDIDDDMRQIKAYYSKYEGKYPENFTTD